jgi:hypothetical protein
LHSDGAVIWSEILRFLEDRAGLVGRRQRMSYGNLLNLLD